MNNTLLKVLVVTFMLSFIWSITMWSKSNVFSDIKTKQIDSLNYQIDSLNNEIFINETIVTRYEISLDYLKEVNPKAAKQFEEYLSHNTE
jgi:hypothetical protein